MSSMKQNVKTSVQSRRHQLLITHRCVFFFFNGISRFTHSLCINSLASLLIDSTLVLCKFLVIMCILGQQLPRVLTDHDDLCYVFGNNAKKALKGSLNSVKYLHSFSSMSVFKIHCLNNIMILMNVQLPNGMPLLIMDSVHLDLRNVCYAHILWCSYSCMCQYFITFSTCCILIKSNPF